MEFDVWQLCVGVGMLLAAFVGVLLSVVNMYMARNKELESRHDRLVVRHHEHIKEVADKYAKKIYVNERIEVVERHVVSRISQLEKQIISQVNSIKELIEAKVK